MKAAGQFLGFTYTILEPLGNTFMYPKNKITISQRVLHLQWNCKLRRNVKLNVTEDLHKKPYGWVYRALCHHFFHNPGQSRANRNKECDSADCLSVKL